MTANEEDGARDPGNPQLSDEDLAVLSEFGTRVRLGDGEPLFKAGLRRGGFFVVLSGAVEVVDETESTARRIALHGVRQFTGDIDILTRRTTVVSAFARGDTELLAVPSSEIRRIIGARPFLGDTLLRAFIARRERLLHSGFGSIRILGREASRDAFRLRELLTRNQVPFTWTNVDEDPGVAELTGQLGLARDELPAVIVGDRPLLRNPPLRELAEAVGLRRTARAGIYDLIVIGAGPAGLGAAVYGASEGLRTLMLDSMAPGGQAGASTRIENYLGFPTGISGAELTGRATLQAQKFGAELSSVTTVVGLDLDEDDPVVHLDDGARVTGRSLLIATGADYRTLDVPGRERFDGIGVYYAATPMELTACRGNDVVVVGGGNSAGQAVMFLSPQTRHVWLLLRGDDLRKNMSSYLAERVERAANVTVLLRSEVRQILGDDCLEGVAVEQVPTGVRRRIDARAVFSFIGAAPRTSWLPAGIRTDAKGFVLTGRDLDAYVERHGGRDPFTLETSRPGIFAAGDVRHGSVKRVASAVGEGAMAIMFVHRFLAERPDARSPPP